MENIPAIFVERIIFLGESYKTRSYYETILISTDSVEFQHFSGYNTSENLYNFSKIIIKQVISIEGWGISSMKERQMSFNKIPTNFTYWDYINAFTKVLYYNNERHKHTCETSDDVQEDATQLCGDTLQQMQDFLFGLKKKDTTA
ncbi:hypothetical protein H5410_015732 [Solanum commersonii]|uniref:Uncharacterized protein n=1 Tax=Solanum commersonii TaxID=4109 RepID=A0A9J5ZVA3_SOLCO|nr:hypothetical protein H5410_015732 [Solanum commersonii]